MKPRLRLVLGALVSVVFTHHTSAATYNWSGGNGAWDTVTASWSGAGSVWPAVTTLDDDATFAGTAGTVTLATGGITANDLTFNTSGYTLTGAALTLNGTTPTLTAGSGITATISSVIAGTAGLTKAGDGTLVLSGANTHTGTTLVSAGTLRAGNAAALGSNTVKTTIASGAVLDVNGQNLGAEVVEVSGTGIGSTGAITNTGTDQAQAFRFVTLLGPTTFGGPNRWDIRKATTSTFDMGGFDLTKTGANYLGLVDTTLNNPGNVTINQGTLNFTFVSTLGTTAAKTVTVNAGGTLGLYQSSPLHGSNLILNTGSILRGENGTGAQNTWAGPVSATGEVTLQADGVLTLNSSITGTANLTKTGGSTATIAATGGISTTGTLAVNAGTLTVNGPLAHSGSLAVSNATLNVNGSSAFAGTTTLTNATLNLNYATDDNSKLHDASALVLAGGTVSLAGGTHPEVVASTTLGAGSTNAINLSSGAAVLNLNAISTSGGATLNFSGDSIATTDNTNTLGILGTWATVGGNQWAVNSSGGPDGPIAALTDFVYSFNLANDNTLYQNKHVVVDSVQAPDAAINPLSLVFNTAFANSLTLQGTNTLATGGILVGTNVGNNTSTLTGGSLTGPNNGDLTIHQRNTTNSLTIASSIVDNGTTHVVKAGPGTLLLSGSNSYSGTTRIAAGSLQIASASAIGGTQVTTSGLGNAALLLGDGIVVPSSRSITIAGSGAAGFFGALSTAAGNTGTSEWQGPVTIGALTGTRIGTLGGTLLISGSIGESAPGSQLLVRNNETVNATTILSGNNTFSGGLQLVVGNLRMAGPNALGTGTLSLGSGTGVNSFSSDGPTARTITVPTALTGTGTINLGDATLNGKLTFTNTVDLAATARTVSTASEVEFSSTLTGTGTLAKTGASTLTLSSANSFSGAVTVSAGKLLCTHANALGTAEKTINANPGGTVELAADAAFPNYSWNTGSGGTGTVILNRATTGTALSQNMTAYFLGNSNINFEVGPNVTTGIPTVNIASAIYSAGATGIGYARLNPVGVNLNIGSLSKSGNQSAIRLGGTSTGNFITSVASGAYSLTKEDSGTWELAGANTYSGATTVSNGKLIFSGTRTAAMGGSITVGNTAGQTGTLDIKGDLPMGTQEFGVGATAATAVGVVNHSAGLLSFTGGNALLIGRTAGNVSGTYNLSGGELKTFANTGRGVMIGVNDGTAGNLINATFNLSATGFLNNATGALQVVRGDSTCSYQNSTYNQTGGTSSNGFLIIGGGIDGANNLNAARGANSTATFSVTGGTFTATTFSGLSRSNNTNSTLTIGGTADVTLPAFPTARGTSSTATLYFDGGILRPAATSGTYLEGLTAAYIKAGGARFNTGAFNITVNQALLTDPVSTGGGLTKEGTGTLSLTGNNTYGGGATLSQGTLNVAHANALGTGPFVNQTNTNTLANTSGAAVTLSNSSYNVSSSLIFGGSTAANDILTGPGNFTLSGSQRILSVNSGVAVTIGGAMSGDLRKDGAGTLVLAGNSNALTGIRVTTGTLRLTGSTAAATALIMGHPTNANVGRFILGGSGGPVNQTFSGLSSEGSAQAGQAVLGGNAAISTIEVNQSTSTTYAGVLGGAGTHENNLALAKSGSGSLALTGTNTYTGNTTVNGGNLSLGNGTTNSNLADAADVSVASGATLNLNYTGTDTIDGLTLNGVAKPPGVWGSTTSGAPNTDPLLTGTGTLTVTSGPSASAYDTWATSFSLTGPGAAFDFDFDNDGIDNGLEWILGGNPTTNSTGILPVATRNLSGDLILTFTREEDAIPESTLKVEIGTNLTTWPKQATIGATSSGPDANGVTVSINTAASPDAVTVTIPASNAPSGLIFARLNAGKP